MHGRGMGSRLMIGAMGLGAAAGGCGGDAPACAPRRVDVPGARSAWRMTVGDVDGDARPDLVTTGGNDPFMPGLTVFRNRGGGAFAAGVAHATAAYDVAVLDSDADGRADLVVTDPAQGHFQILRGEGGGRFAAPARLPAGAAVADLFPADLDGDGRLDLLTLDQSSTITVALATGPGFAAPVSTPTRRLAYGGAVGDVDGDGALDLVASAWDEAPERLALMLGNGDGSFRATELPTGGPPTTLVAALAIADLDADGDADLVHAVPDGAVPMVYVMLGHGDGTFRERVGYPTSANGGVFDLAAADATGDGVIDLLVPTDAGLSVLPGLGDGTFAPALARDAVEFTRMVAVDDVDRDGAVDVVLGGQLAPELVVLTSCAEGA